LGGICAVADNVPRADYEFIALEETMDFR